jgi:hypothetical protein
MNHAPIAFITIRTAPPHRAIAQASFNQSSHHPGMREHQAA